MINSPDLSATRSVLADWIEVTAFLRQRPAGAGDLDSLYRLNSDHDRERHILGDSFAEDEITELDREDLSSRVAEEIGFRAQSLRDLYPFDVVSNPFRVSVKGDVDGPAHSAYIFMLLMSAATYRLLPKGVEITRAIDLGRRLFHLCASFGVAGLLRHSKTYWFGFPRPDKTDFARALAKLCEDTGYAIPHVPPPAGLPQKAKDDQVDVIGWRDFGDKRIGTIFIVCQAATGDDWDGKSVTHHLDAFLDWFERGPYRQAMASLAVPFPGHHEVNEPGEDPFDAAIFNALRRLSGRHGVILDRLRITEAIPSVIEDPNAATRVAGHADVGDFKAWIADFVPRLRAVA